MSKKKDWQDEVDPHSDAAVPGTFVRSRTPVYRGSTVLFPQAAVATDRWNQYDVGYTYGLYGTPTTLELAAKVCELEKGFRTIITPGGQAAISLVHLALLRSWRSCAAAGKHLRPESNVRQQRAAPLWR